MTVADESNECDDKLNGNTGSLIGDMRSSVHLSVRWLCFVEMGGDDPYREIPVLKRNSGVKVLTIKQVTIKRV